MKWNLVCIALFCSAGVNAQAIVEHAAAAAGAAIGVGGGKMLSNALDKTLEKATKTGESTTNPKKAVTPAPVKTTVEARGIAAPEISPIGSTGRARKARRAAAAESDKPVFAAAENPFAAASAMQPAFPRVPSVDDFAKLKEGDSRQEVLTALGVPSSHVTIPDEGHLIEIMTYQDGSRRVGSVRVDNGQVVSVATAR